MEQCNCEQSLNLQKRLDDINYMLTEYRRNKNPELINRAIIHTTNTHTTTGE